MSWGSYYDYYYGADYYRNLLHHGSEGALATNSQSQAQLGNKSDYKEDLCVDVQVSIDDKILFRR